MTPSAQRLSDYTCTALQLANFWQDITVDLKKDRVYLPLDLLARHNYTLEELFSLTFDGRFRALMAEAVAVADDLFQKGPAADQNCGPAAVSRSRLVQAMAE